MSLPKQQILKVYGLLALIAAAGQIVVASLKGFDPSELMIWFGFWLGVFLAAAGFAALAIVARYRWMDPPRPASYPGLTTGIITILFYTDMIGPRLLMMGG